MYRLPQFQKEVLEKGRAKTVNLIHGDEYLIRAFIEKLKSLFGENLSLVWGDEVGFEDLYALASEGSIFSTSKEKAVVILNSEDLFKRAGKNKTNLKAFIDFLRKLRTTKIFFIMDRKLSTQELSKEPYRSISSLGDVISAEKPSQKKIKELVRRKFEKEAGGIDEDALEFLLSLCQENLTVLKQESEKLIAYADGKRIRLEDVKRVCLPWESYTLFDFLDSFFGGDLEGSLRVLRDAYTKGVPALQIISMLSGYTLRLYTISLLLERGEDLEKALDLVGVKHKFLRLKFKGYLEKVSKRKLKKLMEILYRLDLSVKTYFVNPERELEKVTVNFILSSLVSTTPP